MKKKTFIILVLSLIMTIITVGISNRVAYANSNELNAYEDYISYYQDSDEIYDMSDRDNIKPLNYSIRDFESFLYASNLEYLENEQKIKVNGTDPISNIIPIEFFYNEIENVFVGKEYIYFIKTEEIKESNELIAYTSHVAVIDINDNIKNNMITNSYIELSLNRLFEYEYVTVLKTKDYILPYWELNMSILNKMVLSNNIDDDYVIIPLVNISYARIEKNQFPAVNVSNINMLSTFINSNDYNEYDDNYDILADDGYFFTGMAVDYYATMVDIGTKNYLKQSIKTIVDILGILPIGNEIKAGLDYVINFLSDLYEIACDILGLFSYAPVIYTPVTSENQYASETELLYTSAIDQINYYGHLMKNYFAEYTGPALLDKNDHVNTKFQYSYSKNDKSTRINEIINFDLSYGNREYEILYENTKDINAKETNISLNEIIKDEFNEYSCETIYNYNSQTNQELEICCGNNNVMIYEDNILVSLNKRYSFIKNKSYKIVVINRSEAKEGLSYNFYFKGYSTNDIINLDSNESVLYTFESNEDVIRYVDSNANINQLELIQFKENEIYQFIVTNNDSKKDIYLTIKDVEEAIIDDDGYILNDSKFVKMTNDGKTIWEINYKDNKGYYHIYNDILVCSYSNFAVYRSIYFNINSVNSVKRQYLDFNLYYNDMLVEDDFNYVTLDNSGTYSYDYDDINGNLDVHFLGLYEYYNGDNVDSYVSQNNNRIFTDCGYGEYSIFIFFYIIVDDGSIVTNYAYTKHWNIYYVPNYNSITFDKFCANYENNNVCLTLKITLTGAYAFLNHTIKGNEIINPRMSNNNSNLYTVAYDVSINCGNINDINYIIKYLLINIVIEAYDYIPYIPTKLQKSSMCAYQLSNDSFKILISPFEYEYSDNQITYLIKNYEQLKLALTYSEYGYIQYDDGINYDVEIYGYINSYNFKVINEINCLNQTLEISKGILYAGTFDGCGYTISNLYIKVLKDEYYDYEINGNRIVVSRNRGIFESNYGVIKNVKFYSVIFDVTLYKLEDKIYGLITPSNYGVIDTNTIKYSNCYYRYLLSKSVPKYKEITDSNKFEVKK